MSTVPPPPPPPDDPFPPISNGDRLDPFANGDNGEQHLGAATPNVAARPGRVLIVVAGLGAVLFFLLYSIFFSEEEAPPPEPQEMEVAPAPITPPALPEVEPIAPPPVFVPPSIPEPTRLDLLTPEEDNAAQEARKARLSSEMLIEGSDGGGLGGLLDDKKEAATPTSSNPNSQFEASVINANTKAERVEATHIGDLRRTIAQGRIIQATTESVINTELPGQIRAIVSRDTYGEAGTTPLIPKGSRLIGSFNTEILGGQSRSYVIWTRVIRPDGVDVMINSQLVDQIGQAGIGGQVDSKFQQLFSRAVMASVISISFAIGSDAISGGGETTTTTSSLGSSTTGDSASTATVNALNRLGATTDGFLQKFINVNPTILVDQGTPVNVFVSRDLVFPSEVTGARIVN